MLTLRLRRLCSRAPRTRTPYHRVSQCSRPARLAILKDAAEARLREKLAEHVRLHLANVNGKTDEHLLGGRRCLQRVED